MLTNKTLMSIPRNFPCVRLKHFKPFCIHGNNINATLVSVELSFDLTYECSILVLQFEILELQRYSPSAKTFFRNLMTSNFFRIKITCRKKTE